MLCWYHGDVVGYGAWWWRNGEKMGYHEDMTNSTIWVCPNMGNSNTQVMVDYVVIQPPKTVIVQVWNQPQWQYHGVWQGYNLIYWHRFQPWDLAGSPTIFDQSHIQMVLSRLDERPVRSVSQWHQTIRTRKVKRCGGVWYSLIPAYEET